MTAIDKYWQLQKAANLSNTQAAEYLGLNISTIKRYRNGKLSAPKTVIMALEAKVKKINNEQ
ncbi:hypothetical protein ZP9_00043 [Shewanella phage ZP9]|nr:hypothetical protein ZP9_00043 [Shewanella phage ZP9]